MMARGVPSLRVGLLALVLATLTLFYINTVPMDQCVKYSHNCATMKDAPIASALRLEIQLRNITHFHSYQEAIIYLASPTKSIMLAFFDNGALEIAMNFYETSIFKHGIQNFLFLSSSQSACTAAQNEGAPCYVYATDSASDKHSVYMSTDFIRKMNIRTYMILEALKLGYNVLHTDVDMIFFQDPLPDVESRCPVECCDIAPLWDSIVHNAGFLFIRSTKPSFTVYEEMKRIAENTKLDDQTALNNVVKKGDQFGLRLTNLPEEQYQSGRKYFEDGQRTFAEHARCVECIVMHNNWMVSIEAKIYRFKEMHQWMYDGPQKYYSDPHRLYLSYDNPLMVGDTWAAEKEAFVNALTIGHLLNRTVILPRFHTKSENDTLLSHARILTFDHYFGGSYRESAFLAHCKVPHSVKQSVSTANLIENKKHNHSIEAIRFVPQDMSMGATTEEIMKWFSDRTESVLHFSSLYGAFSQLSQEHFTAICHKAIQPAVYRQYEEKS